MSHLYVHHKIKDYTAWKKVFDAFVLKANKEDATVFVDDVWKQHIDRDWRDALSNESVLGKVEYASLDRYVSELAQEKIDQKFIAYAFVVLVIIIGAWWFLVRRPKGKQGSPPAPAAPAKP